MDAFLVPGTEAFIRYTAYDGRAPALVYLTGLGIAVGGTYDRCVVDPVLGARRAVLVDVFGAGLSDAPLAFAYALDDHAATIAALIDHLGITAAVVVAYSFGGAIAITLAAARPDLVAGLVLAEPNLDPGGGFLSRRIAEQAEDAFVATGFAELVADAESKARGGDRSWAVTAGMLRIAAPHALHRSATGLVKGTRPTMRERLLALRVPRAIIRGERSGPNPREPELRAAGIHLQTVAAADHGMPWQNPDGFVAAVRAAC